MPPRKPPTAADLARIEVELAPYTSRLFTAEQSARYLDELKTLVVAAGPSSSLDASQVMTAVCRFLADTMPADGGLLEELLTEPRLARWVNTQKSLGAPIGTIYNVQGRVRRLIRVLNGLPGRSRERRPPSLPLAPFSDAELDRLVAAVCAAGDPAMRGLVGSVGCGVIATRAVGGQIRRGDRCAEVVLVDGSTRAVLPQLAGVAATVAGQMICDGDWEALRAAGVPAVVAVNNERAHQTYRWLAFTLDAPVAALMRTYQLTYSSIEGVLPYLSIETPLPHDVILDLLRDPCATDATPGTLGPMASSTEGPQA